jgi:hypothetical protein
MSDLRERTKLDVLAMLDGGDIPAGVGPATRGNNLHARYYRRGQALRDIINAHECGVFACGSWPGECPVAIAARELGIE